MAGQAPIQLGSATGTGWTFESGSNTTTDQYGIQTCAVKALFPQGDQVFSNMPAQGTTFSTVFGGNTYLPSSFLLDFFDGAPTVEYLDARVARATFKFKRIDPLFANRRTVSADSIINYQNNALSQTVVWTDGIAQNNVFGFPDPTVSVKYSVTSMPGIGTGGLSSLYALPGSSNAQGFPAVPTITIPYTFRVGAGAVISYWDGTAFQSCTCNTTTTLVYNIIFVPNPRGWQLVKLKFDPIANQSFFAVEEQWRNFYTFFGVQFTSIIPPCS